jgi:hypothetical protein
VSITRTQVGAIVYKAEMPHRLAVTHAGRNSLSPPPVSSDLDGTHSNDDDGSYSDCSDLPDLVESDSTDTEPDSDVVDVSVIFRRVKLCEPMGYRFE